MPRLWKPAVSCVKCMHANDFDYNFCQRCGYKKETSVITKPPPLVEVDSYHVQKRLESLNTCHSMKPYQRQKSALQSQLKSYLSSLPDKKNLNIATLQDIVSFLIWRDKFGKTILHSKDCAPSLREKGSCSFLDFLLLGR